MVDVADLDPPVIVNVMVSNLFSKSWMTIQNLQNWVKPIYLDMDIFFTRSVLNLTGKSLKFWAILEIQKFWVWNDKPQV